MKSKKTILIFSGYYYPHLGGIERYIDNLSHQLIKKNYDVIIVTSNHDKKENIVYHDGVKIIRLPIFKIFSQRYPIPKLNSEYRKLMKEINPHDVESIIVNTRFHLNSHIGARFGKKYNIPVYLIEHGSNYVTLDNKFIDFFANRYEDFLTFIIKKKIKGFYGVSKACSDWLVRFKIKASGVWYNSINDLNTKRKKHNTINFLYAGRLIKQKGVDNILDSFTSLLKKHNNIKLYIAGDGPEYQRYISSYSDDRIVFLGKLSFDELLNYYAITDVFLYPPLWPEGLPTSILEAGMMKCAVIGTNQGGIVEVIKDNYNGLIVDTSSKDLQKAMDYLINNPAKLDEYANNLKKTVEEDFSWKNTTNKILSDIKNN